MKKKFIYLFSLLLACGMTACSNNDGPTPHEVEVSSGFYTINDGNDYGNIPTSITAYDFSTGTVTDPLQDAFMAANGIALGKGAQTALIYDSNMYICMSESNLIWVVDPETLKIKTKIVPEGEAANPRDICAKDGKLYVSMYTGYVCRIDPTTMKIDATVKTGPNPEQMGIGGNKLYVANSDGFNYASNYSESSISIIDLSTLNESKIKDIGKIMNPTNVASNGTDVFVVCMGNYNDVPAVVKKIVGNDVVDVAQGTMIAVDGNDLYLINSPYGQSREDMSFKIYDTKTFKEKGDIATQTAGTESWVDYPNAISVDPVSGDIVILSCTLSAAGWAQFKEPCYANIYTHDGTFKKRITCGVGARAVTFVHKKVIK